VTAVRGERSMAISVSVSWDLNDTLS